MKDSQIKKGIDEAIGEEKWLTDELVHKMMLPKKPKKKNKLPPILAAAIIACIALFLVFVEYNKVPEQQIAEEENNEEMPSGQIDTNQFYNFIEDEEAAEVLINYLRAHELKDYEKVKSMVSGQLSNYYDELFKRYENVDFKSIQLLKVFPMSHHGYVVYLTHKNIEDGQSYMHSINLTFDFDESVYVGDYIDSKWQPYEPFELPKTIALNYSDVGQTQIQLTPLSRELKPISEPFTLSDGGIATMYQRDETYYFIIEKDGKYHYIPYYDYYANEDPQYVIYEVPLQTDSSTGTIGLVEARNNSSYEKRLYFLYSELKGTYQYYESKNSIADLMIDLDQDGQFEIIFDDGIGSIVKIEDGLMKATNIAYNLRNPEWLRGFITVDLEGSIATVTYTEANGSKSGFYDFKSTNEIILYD
ncbi:hypothetical protein UACE39S_02724 [Ureibacillus acetophenoni]